jgi:hypothetical protein
MRTLEIIDNTAVFNGQEVVVSWEDDTIDTMMENGYIDRKSAILEFVSKVVNELTNHFKLTAEEVVDAQSVLVDQLA